MGTPFIVVLLLLQTAVTALQRALVCSVTTELKDVSSDETEEFAANLLSRTAAQQKALPSHNSSLFDHSWSLSAFSATIRPLKMLSPLKNVASTTMRQYVIRIRKQGKQWKVERDESAGNVTAVVAVLAPAAGAVSKTHTLRGPGDVYGITTASHCHLDLSLQTKERPSIRCWSGDAAVNVFSWLN